jgi:antirestriction protein ArdC
VSGRVYELVTERILASLKAGTVPWRKPWSEQAPPENALTRRPYRGVNVLLLGMSPYRDHRWLSLRQAGELGGRVRTGERSSLAVFWKRWEPRDATEEDTRETGRTIPILRYYRVFNVEQCEGLRLAPLMCEERANRRIVAAEQILAGMPDPPVIEEGGSAAWYRPRDDRVRIPPFTRFQPADAYYATLFHELGHATGHQKRLDRPGVMESASFGSEVYSREELVAELTSAFLCAASGLDNSLVENAASYISGWTRALEKEPKAIVVAAAQAQRAADFIRGEDVS